MRKSSAGLEAGVGTALSTVRSASGLGRRTPKKNARKRIILQEKISRELSASRNRVSDGQVRCTFELVSQFSVLSAETLGILQCVSCR
jgi:hypothetical protein